MTDNPRKAEAEAVAKVWRDKIIKAFGVRLTVPKIVITRAGRRYVSEYLGAAGKDPAEIRINSEAIGLNPWKRIELSIGHEMAHHCLYTQEVDAGVHGHGAAFKRIVRGLGIPCRGQYAKVGPANLPKAKTTRYAYRCRCPKGRIVRAVYLNARCLDCNAMFARVDIGQVEPAHEHGFTVGEKIRHKTTKHRGEIVGVGPDSIAIRSRGGKIRGFPPSALERIG